MRGLVVRTSSPRLFNGREQKPAGCRQIHNAAKMPALATNVWALNLHCCKRKTGERGSAR
jgi:hypothetical protein